MFKRILFASLALAAFIPALPADVAAMDLEGLEWREIGPYRGGRSAAVAGIPQDRETYYFGATGGGVWKTTNAGTTWTPVFDDQGSYSIGEVVIDPNNPNVVWVGTGENNDTYGGSGRELAWSPRSW